MSYEETKILEFNQYQKYDKTPFIIYALLECIIEKIDECKNNSWKFIYNISKQTHSIRFFSMSTISSFRSIDNKHDVYRGSDCMKTFCGSLREHTMKVVNFKKKRMKLLTKEQYESFENTKICYTYKNNFEN